jgi:hypothetical protein
VSTKYYALPKKFEEKMSNPLKGEEEKQLSKKKLNIPISNFFIIKERFK